jgi:hypothetical protein
MSANLKTIRFDSDVLTYKVIYDSTLDATPNDDVTTEPGFLYSIVIANTNGTHAGVLKISLTATTVTLGAGSPTPPDIMISVPLSTTTRVTIPGGVAFTKLSFWQTTSTADAAATATSTAFAVTLVTS